MQGNLGIYKGNSVGLHTEQ